MPLKFRELIEKLQNYNGEDICEYVEKELKDKYNLEPLETFVRLVKFG